ncbi:MAG TPA: HIT domain-containing protein [Candidatus Paceibacterota bacterium]
MIDDVFCRIINKELSAEFVIEDKDFIVIEDIHPAAPVHVLIIPKKHLDIIHEISHEELDILGKMFIVAGQAAKKLGVEKTGYRLILNQGPNAGQLVPHLHLHLLAGKPLGSKIVN